MVDDNDTRENTPKKIDHSFVINVQSIKSIVTGEGPIIVVDDDETQLSIVQLCYQKSGKQNELICMSRGDELLSYLDGVCKNMVEVPELVLLDINLPEMSGFEILSEIREQELFKYMPVFIFSTSDLDLDKEKAYNLQASAYFSKPAEIKDYIKFFQLI